MSIKFSLKDKELLKAIYNFAKARKVKLYLVGGILRDILLRREKENPDFDFCLKRGAINFGRKLAQELKSGFVILDKDHGACRIVYPVRGRLPKAAVGHLRCPASNGVKKMKDKICTLDFTDFRGKTLEKDLLHRDFTINAIALELGKVFVNDDLDDVLVDPHSGKADLKQKIVRIVNKKAFAEDPLRILRAFSFSSILGFKIDKETLRLAKFYKDRLSQVSFERIRDELFKIFDTPNTFDYLLMLDNLKILKIIFPEIEKMRGLKQGPYHHLDIWRHSLETVKQLELLIRQIKRSQDIQAYLNEVISSERKRRALIKLGALLHDVGKPDALRREKGKLKFHGHERIGCQISKGIAARLKLSNDELDSLGKIVFWHLRPGYLGDSLTVSKRASFRYFRDTGKEAVSTLLISLADQRSTRGPLTTEESRVQHEKICKGLIKEYFSKLKEKKFPRLISGNDLIKQFKLEPSRLIGKILREIEELQAIGKIKNKQEALKAAQCFIARK